ncbi:MAG TPA: hypothetical protein DEP19_08795 [Anaerolineae bacterium]|nr:hypothetical protein [Anaerolineae bacterium]
MNEKVKLESISEDDLVSELWARDVRFILGSTPNHPPKLLPSELIIALAKSNEARLQLSLIPLFLRHPEFDKYVNEIIDKLNSSQQLILQCFYSAAVWLEQKHFSTAKLEDLFSKKLEITLSKNPEENLQSLAIRQQELSGEKINWLGTYEHAANIWLKEIELQQN